MEFLLLTLYAPLVSWGDIAVGEARGSWVQPSRSAILGLIAAALGITRDDQEAHNALDSGYGFAVRLDAPGTPVTDYHTAQAVAASAVKRVAERGPITRATLLNTSDRATIISRRAYRQDALATVAIWSRASGAWSLAHLAEALRRPAFVLYAGRKSNAFGLPLGPEVVTAATLADAFTQRRDPARGIAAVAVRPVQGWGREVTHDPCDGFSSGLRPLRRQTRRDAHADRTQWQFRERPIDVGLIEPGSGHGTLGA
jgi:CRISPR system Cascade subunit CasD